MSFNKNKNNLNLTPRTHISIDPLNKDDSKPLKLSNPKKEDKVDIGLKKLIFLGKIIKNYFPHKDNLLRRRALLEMKNSDSNKKLTPFQLYQKNKKMISVKLRCKRNFEIKLKTINSEKNFRRKEIMDDSYIKKMISLNSNNSPNKYYNTIGCSFKNKLIKSVFAKNKNKKNLQFKAFNFTESNFNNGKDIKKDEKDLIKFRNLLSNENIFNTKRKNLIDDLQYEKDKMLLLNKNKIMGRKKFINLFNEIKNSKNTKNTKTITEENDKNFFNQIPLIRLSNLNYTNNNFGKLLFNNNIKNNFFKRKKIGNTFFNQRTQKKY